MFDGVFDQLFDAGVGDGGFVVELVEGAACFDQLEEGFGIGGHFGGWGCREVLGRCGWLLIEFEGGGNGGGLERFIM